MDSAFRRKAPPDALTVPRLHGNLAPVAHSAATLQTEGDDRQGRRRLLPGWRPLTLVVVLAFIAAVFLIPYTKNPFIELFGETLFVGIMLMTGFRLAGAWRQELMPRWLAQVIAVSIAAALAPLIVQLLGSGGNFFAFIESRHHVRGYVLVTVCGAIIGTLFTLGALYREQDARARARELQFALLRETLERQATAAQLHLMTAQIQPHFLLNTLANVQELVESGSPRAVPVFRSLIAYLRAAVPQLQQEDSTLGDEERLVAAYLELMQMRMPDRLDFRIDIDPALRSMRFPTMALLTLVENAIQHGVDPHTEPSRVEVGARLEADGEARVWVADTGIGMASNAGEGTGLANLRARLRAFFGARASFELSEEEPQGVRAEVRVRPVTA
jgi:signal transduction histidine kinase